MATVTTVKTNSKGKGGKAKTNWYHTVIYFDANHKRIKENHHVDISFRCNKKHPKKCHGKYKNKDGHFCQAYKDAEDRVKNLKHATETQSLNLESLSKAERVEWAQAAELAKRVGMPMIQIVQIAEQHKGPLKPLDISEGILLFIEAKKAEGCSEGTTKGWKRDLKRISGKFRGQVHELRTEAITKWAMDLTNPKETKKPLAPKSQRSMLGSGGTWWNWMKTMKYSVGIENPFTDCTRKKSPRKPVTILGRKDKDTGEFISAVDEAREVLNAATKDPYLAAVVVLVMFCGLRTEEAQKMVWEWIHLQHPMVEVPAVAAKKGEERFNEFQIDRLDLNLKTLPPNGLAWLQYVSRKVYLMPMKGAQSKPRKQIGAVLPVNPSTYRNRKKKHLKMISWRANVLRHTFCSMHMAAFKDHPLTSTLAGNSVRELKASYKRPVPQDNALEYFSIMPPVDSTTKPKLKVGQDGGGGCPTLAVGKNHMKRAGFTKTLLRY
jgi:integrase